MFVGPNITDQMRRFSRQFAYRRVEAGPPVERDRSLAGKKRIRARKALNRGSS